MSGYTPLFQSITTGTLCGKWPDIGLWPIVLSLGDRYGVVDVTVQYLATITGLPADDVAACMRRFCEPDPMSRSCEHNGARLVLLEDHRDWGWKIVNHGKYAEKARLMHKNAREVESGKNRDRQATKSKTAGHRRSPPVTPTQAQTQSQSQTNRERGAKRAPASFTVDIAMYEWASAELGLGAELVQAATKQFMDHEFKTAKRDWPAAWRNWMRRTKEFSNAAHQQDDSFDAKLAQTRARAGL